MNFRAVLAMLVCKALRLVSRILHRGGTAMPGRIALKIYPELLSLLAKDVRTVAVTGTNGKTTSSRMIEQAFLEQILTWIYKVGNLPEMEFYQRSALEQMQRMIQSILK